MKKLFLASEGVDPASLSKLKDFVGGSFNNKKIVYVPTAANGHHYGAWKAGESINIVQTLGTNVEIVELESFIYQNIYSKIKGTDILWIAGGQTGYLLYWFRRSGLDKKLEELLESGTVYVGSSAGSMAVSKTQDASDWYLGDPEPGANLIPGLGLIDFEIYPHYEEDLLPEIKRHWKKGDLYLLKNGEAITVVNGKADVLGEKRILRAGKIIKS